MRRILGCILAAVCLALAVQSARAAVTDVTPGSWYESAMMELAQAGALKGYPDGSFRPSGSLSRAEACILFQNVLRKQAAQPPRGLSERPGIVPARPGASADGPWSQEDLTKSGRFVFSRFLPRER